MARQIRHGAGRTPSKHGSVLVREDRTVSTSDLKRIVIGSPSLAVSVMRRTLSARARGMYKQPVQDESSSSVTLAGESNVSTGCACHERPTHTRTQPLPLASGIFKNVKQTGGSAHEEAVASF
jgi:hypothetical protein